MIAVHLLSREELEKKLAPYGCKCLGQIAAQYELWETGWGEPFTLYQEIPDRYADIQYRNVMILIAKTMPQDWNNGNGGGSA